MLCPPSEVKNQSRSLFLNFESYTNYLIEDEKQIDVHTFQTRDGVILVALVQPVSFSYIHSFNMPLINAPPFGLNLAHFFGLQPNHPN